MNKELLRLLGSFPARPQSLDMEVLDELELPNHKRQLISYRVEPDETIKAWLLWPKSTGRKGPNGLPAVVGIHPHGEEYYIGKSETAGLQKRKNRPYGLELAERGYVVIIPDQLAFEERRPAQWESEDNECIRNEKYERLVYFQRLLKGSTLQAKYLSDLSRAVDVVSDLDIVDGERIGAIGHSLGGQETIWLMMYDERVIAGVSCCGVSTYEAIFADDIVHNYPFYVPDLLLHGDMDTYMQDIAPRALMMLCGSDDPIFPIRGVRRIGSALSQHYKALDAEDKYRLEIFSGAHEFTKAIREQAYGWLDAHL